MAALSPRQRSLDALLDWSYELLSPDEQASPAAPVGVRHQLRPRDRGARRRLGRRPWPTTCPSSSGRWWRSRWRWWRARRCRPATGCSGRSARWPPSTWTGPARRGRPGSSWPSTTSAPSRSTRWGNRTWRSNLDVELPTLSELVGLLVADGEVELGHALARLVVEHEIGLSLGQGIVAVDAALAAADEASPRPSSPRPDRREAPGRSGRPGRLGGLARRSAPTRSSARATSIASGGSSRSTPRPSWCSAAARPRRWPASTTSWSPRWAATSP